MTQSVLHENNMPAHIENILRLLPETKNVAVIVGNSPVEQYWAAELKRDFQQFANRVNFTWFNELTFSQMLTQAATMPPNSAIYILLLIEDAAGVPYTQGRALEKFREVASAPIFGLGDFELGRGVVGGPLLQTQGIGERAADVAIRILRGEPPNKLKITRIPYGYPQLRLERIARWNISEAMLPPAALCIFENLPSATISLAPARLSRRGARLRALSLLGHFSSTADVTRGAGIATPHIGSHPSEPHGNRGRAVGFHRS